MTAHLSQEHNPERSSETGELLRRMVLTERDDYSDGILGLLKAAGYDVAWAKVSGARLSVYVWDRAVAERLVAAFGGSIQQGWSPGDRWDEWHWTAQP